MISLDNYNRILLVLGYLTVNGFIGWVFIDLLFISITSIVLFSISLGYSLVSLIHKLVFIDGNYICESEKTFFTVGLFLIINYFFLFIAIVYFLLAFIFKLNSFIKKRFVVSK